MVGSVAAEQRAGTRRSLSTTAGRLTSGLRRRLVDADVRDVRRMMVAYRRTGPAVLCWHDSVWISVAREDRDRRSVGPMLGDRLGDLMYLGRGGYHAGVYRALAGALEHTASKPQVVMFPLTLPRGTSAQWRLRPDLRFEETIRRIDRLVESPRPLAWLRRPPPFPSPDAWATYLAQPVESRFSDLRTVAEFEAVKDERPETEDGRRRRARELFAFHFGHTTASDNERYVELAGAVARLARIGVRCITYVSPVNIAGGEELLGAQFTDHVRAELATVRALVTAAAPATEFLDLSEEFAPELFFHRWHSAEHLREDGRQRLAEFLASAASGAAGATG